MTKEVKTRVVVTNNYREAQREKDEFIKLLVEAGIGDTILKVRQYEIDFTDGRKLYFVPRSEFFKWCKGRTYWIGDRVEHSGYEVKP